MPGTPAPPKERLLRHVEAGHIPPWNPTLGPCWIWTGSVGGRNRGYGYTRYGPDQGSRKVPAHRLAYELFVGPIPDGYDIDHLCRETLCVNPSHLEAVTRHENQARGVRTFTSIHGPKTHCIHGHEFTPENTKIEAGRYRRCRTCLTEKAKRRWQTIKAQRGGQ